MELRVSDFQSDRLAAREVARASEVLWSSEAMSSSMSRSRSSASQEHRRCCGAPR